jgi:hypothetical protein
MTPLPTMKASIRIEHPYNAYTRSVSSAMGRIILQLCGGLLEAGKLTTYYNLIYEQKKLFEQNIGLAAGVHVSGKLQET